MYSRRQFATRLAAFSALTAACARPASAAEPQPLRFGCISVAGTPTYDEIMVPFARAIEQGSDGRLAVALKPVGGYGSTAAMLTMVEKGDLELLSALQGYYADRFPRSSVVELPLLFDTAKVGARTLAALFKEGLIAPDYTTLKVVALYVAPPFGLFTTGRKITSVRDFRGLRIRTPGTTVGLALARLGAIPLGMPMTAVGSAITGGIVDAVAVSQDTMLTTKGADGKFLYEHMNVAVDMRFAAPAQFVVMNQAKWQALPPDLQAMIDKCAVAFIENDVQNRDAAEDAARRKLAADPRYTYITPTPELRDALRQGMAPAYDDWVAGMARHDIDGERLLSRTRALAQQFSVAAN